MAQVGRSTLPLYQTLGRPVAWRITMTNPDGSAMDLTGSEMVATLYWDGTDHPLAVGAPLGADGVVGVSGPGSIVASLPLGQLSRLHLTHSDSLGVTTDFVWPVVGEVP